MSSVSTISSPGISSGLDVNSIISSLMAVETQPLLNLQQAEAKLQAKLSGMGQLQSLVSAFNDALTPLLKADTFQQTLATSSDGAVAVSSTAKARPGGYSVHVGTLSAAQTLVSPIGQFTAATDVVGTGTLTLQLGTWDGATFNAKAGSTAVAITIGPEDNTLEKIRDKINATAGAGVTASIVTDSSGARLSLRSTSNGAENGFKVTVADDDGVAGDAAGLSRLAYDPSTATSQLTLAQPAANATGTINGIPVSSATDTFVDTVEGLTIQFLKTTTAPATVTVKNNTDAVKAALNRLVTTYNDLAKFVTSQTGYDAKTKTGALFQGDSAMVGVQSQMRTMLAQSSTASAVFGTLSSIGIEMQKDGTLTMNNTKLDAAVKNLPELHKALAAEASAGGGLVRRISGWATGMLSATGTLPSRSQSIQRTIDANHDSQEAMTKRLEMTEARLRKQYAALDATMAKYNALNSYVAQQMEMLSKSMSAD